MVNLGRLESILEYPTRGHISDNTVRQVCKLSIWSKVKNSASSRLQLIVPVLSHDITKNLMGHRFTYRVDSQISKMNRWTNSFQSVWRFFYETSLNDLFSDTRIWVTWLWKALDVKLLTPGQILGIWVMWKVGGITIECKRACYIFVRRYTEIDE